MKRFFSLAAVSILAMSAGSAFGATLLISDKFSGPNVNSGFLLGEGFNSGITETNTRLTGTLATNVSYARKGNKNDTAYTISNNRGNITQGSQSGRFTLAARGTTNAFDFGPALLVSSATPQSPQIYKIGISMNNKVNPTNSPGRMSFAFGTTEGGGGSWNFGIQIVPVSTSTNYNIIKRIRMAASGLTNELNLVITNAVAAGTEVDFVMRVTDAGAETDTNFNSRVELSIDGGTNWIYDTKTDPSLTNGFRFDAATRYVSFDQAPNNGADTYDNFFISLEDPVVATTTLSIAAVGGNANITLQGTEGRSYIIERSPDLATWSGVYTNTAGAGGVLQYSEVPPAATSFYRSRAE